MMIYILIAISIFFSLSLIYVTYKNTRLKIQLDFLNHALTEQKELVIDYENKKINYIQKIEQLFEKTQYQEQFIANFEKLREESTKATKATLFDLGNELSKQLIDIHKKENQESREISEKKISDTTAKFNNEFERIVNMVGILGREITQSKNIVDVIKNSLLSPSGAGSLAEITLENILKSSGLRKTLDFTMQYNIISKDKNILRPDALIFLPNNNLMVVDAKASKFLIEDTEDLKNLARTMHSHLKSLSGKSYAENLQKSLRGGGDNFGNVVTLMFLPSEHSIEKLIEADKDFMSKAWKFNILPVGPAGLMNMLYFAKFQISEKMMIHNHQQIIEEVKNLVASVSTMANHSLRLGNSISSLVSYYDKFAGSFNRNFLSKVRNISSMGVETDLKKNQVSLQRLQVVFTKSEIIEIEKKNTKIDKIDKI